MALRIWPKRIRVEQDVLGVQHADCFDAGTGEHLTAVLRVEIETPDSTVWVTMSKYDPLELALNHPDDQESQGIAVETRGYPIRKLHLEAGS